MFRWRADADLVTNAPLTRRIMPLIMRRRNESIVFFEQNVPIAGAQAHLRALRERTGKRASLLHLMMWASARMLSERPRLNRFTAGGRIWQRRGIWISFSAKKAKSDDAPIVVLKRRIDPAWSLEELVDRIEGDIQEGRSDKKSSTDQELGLLFLLPHFIGSALVRLLMWADHMGLLPGFITRSDPLFASMLIANLGSIDMDAGFHHLYEYGNIPIFLTAGRSRLRTELDDTGAPITVDTLNLKFAFDERVEDGLYCAAALERLRALIEDPTAGDEGAAKGG